MYSYTVIILTITALLDLVAAQTVDPTKVKWCQDQKSSCPLLCLQIPGVTTEATEANTCDPTSLDYSCICSNGQSPNASQYSQTIPYFECTTANTQCVNNCPNGDSACQSNCVSNHPCGAQSPTRVNTSTISTTLATSTSSATTGSASPTAGNEGGSSVYTGFGGSTATASASPSSGTSSAEAIAIGFGRTYGLALVLAAVCGGFTFLL